ncbi:hypothetical protein [Brevibacillus centrosporus]
MSNNKPIKDLSINIPKATEKENGYRPKQTPNVVPPKGGTGQSQKQ